MRYIKDGRIVNNGYMLIRSDGRTVLNAPHEMWLAEGWEVYEDSEIEVEPETPPTLEGVRFNILSDCEHFYDDIICKVVYNNERLWVPIETRTAYRLLLEDIKAAGEETVEFKGITLSVDQALAALASVNAYCFQVSKVYNNHVATIKNLSTIEELEQYDYTINYPSNLVF